MDPVGRRGEGDDRRDDRREADFSGVRGGGNNGGTLVAVVVIGRSFKGVGVVLTARGVEGAGGNEGSGGETGTSGKERDRLMRDEERSVDLGEPSA